MSQTTLQTSNVQVPVSLGYETQWLGDLSIRRISKAMGAAVVSFLDGIVDLGVSVSCACVVLLGAFWPGQPFRMARFPR